MAFVLLTGYFFFKPKTAYEKRISDWSSDVCSADLLGSQGFLRGRHAPGPIRGGRDPGNELAVLHQPVDPPLDAFDGNTLQTKVERGLAELVDRPSRLTLGHYAHRRGDSRLRTRFPPWLNPPPARLVDHRPRGPAHPSTP